MLEGVANNINGSTERKNVFLAANQDYLSLPISNTITNSNDIDLEIVFTLDDWNTTTIEGITGFGDYLTNHFYVDKWLNPNQILIQIYSSGAAIYTRSFTVSPTLINTLKIQGGQMFFNGVEFGAGTGFNNLTVSLNQSSTTVGASPDGSSISGEITNFTINGETFSLNEGNGLTSVGSNGTIVTRNTSHSDNLNYINHNVIKPI